MGLLDPQSNVLTAYLQDCVVLASPLAVFEVDVTHLSLYESAAEVDTEYVDTKCNTLVSFWTIGTFSLLWTYPLNQH